MSDNAPPGFEAEWATSGKFRMMIAEQREREAEKVAQSAACKRCGTEAYSSQVLETMGGHCYRCHDQTTLWYC